MAVLAFCLVLGLTGCDGLLGAERRIERAAAEFAAGDHVAAMKDAKTALEAEPDNVAGRVLLARISLHVGDFAAARKELDRALLAGADPAELRDLHYAIFLQQGQYQDAQIAAATDEDLTPLRRHLVMGFAHLGLGQNEDAGRHIDEALKLDPGNVEASVLQARWLWATGRIDEAGQALERLLERQPDLAEAWMYQGRFKLGVGKAEEALAALEQAQKTAERQLNLPDQLAVHAGIVESRMALGQLDRADAALQGIQVKFPDAFVTRYLRARLAFMRGDYRVAVAELQRSLTRQPGNAAARLLLGASLLEMGSAEQAEAELSRLVAEHPENMEARKLLARIYVSRNDAAAARRVLANAPALEVRDPGTDWLTGSVMLAAGQTAEAIGLLEQAAAASPANVPLQLDLARAYLMAGRRAEAETRLAGIPAGEGGLVRRQLAVLAEVAGKDTATARQGIDRLAREHAADATLLTVAGAYLYSTGDATGAARLLDQAIKVDPRNLDARLGLAAAAMRNGQPATAEEQLRHALEFAPNSERALLGLAGVALARGDRAGGRQWLERAISADPGAVEPRLQLAQLALSENDLARMRSLVDQALEVTKDRAQTLNRVGQLWMGATHYDEALARFGEAAGLGADDAAVNAGLALLALGRTEEARARLESISSRRRDWVAPVVYLAALDSGQRRFDQALARIDALQKAGGPAAAADEIRGDVHRAAGKPADAAAAYARAQAANPSAALAIKLYQARSAAGTPNPAATLDAWLRDHPRDAAVRTLLAEFRQQQGDRPGAIAQYERVMEIAATPAVMNNLAWLYYEAGDARALSLAKQAYDAAPGSASMADTYGWILVEKGRAAEGMPILAQAAKAAPNNPEIRYHHAAALARTGQRQQAVAVLRDLLASAGEFPSRQAAVTLLGTLPRN